MGWEYQKINLNELPRRSKEIDVLCDAGEAGWELITILPNNVAYLKRERDEVVTNTTAPTISAATREATTVGNGAAEAASNVHDAKAKYRDPKTSETWSGRGRMANWLKRKQDAGEDIEEYRA